MVSHYSHNILTDASSHCVRYKYVVGVEFFSVLFFHGKQEAVEQVAMEVDVPKLEGKKPQERQLCNLLNVDFEKLKSLETFQLKEQIFKGVLSSKNSKV